MVDRPAGFQPTTVRAPRKRVELFLCMVEQAIGLDLNELLSLQFILQIVLCVVRERQVH